MSSEMMKFIGACVALRKNIVVSGGTGSGKTSLLNAISLCIGPTERIITVEDSLELKLQQSHVVRMEARPPNAEGKGEVSIRALVKNCLRMRPDRIVVGECRGGEALDMLQAMNTGHDGSLTTVHANTPSDTVARLETLCLMAGMDMPLSAIRAQIASAVSVIVQTARLSDGSRKTVEIAEVCGLDEKGNAKLRTLFEFRREGVEADVLRCLPAPRRRARPGGVRRRRGGGHMIDVAIAAACLLAFAVLVGIAVRGLLAASARDRDESDDVMARAARVGETGMPEFLARRMRERRAAKVRAELPDALDMVANSLGAGLTLPQAILRNLDHFPPLVAEEFARVIYDTRLGYSVGGAFDNFARRLPTPDVRMVAIASSIGVAHGGNLAESYRMLSTLLRDNLAFEAELKAMTTEGRMQAIVMSALPLVMLVLLGLVKRDLVSPLFTTAAGWGALALLFAMQGLAYLWIRKIVDIKV